MATLRADVFIHSAKNFPYQRPGQRLANDIELVVRPEAKVLSFTKRSVELSTCFELTVDAARIHAEKVSDRRCGQGVS